MISREGRNNMFCKRCFRLGKHITVMQLYIILKKYMNFIKWIKV